MTADVELLPLYAELQGHPKLEIIKHYARANVAHATEPLKAEIERLRAEVERLQSINSGLCRKSNYYLIDSARWQERAERLAEALRLIAAPKRQDGTWNRDREACRQIAAEALRDHDQEGKNG